MACKFGHDDVLRLLLERSPADVLLIDACWAADEGRAREVLERNPGLVERLGDAGRRQVADAARNNQAAVVSLMLNSGWAVDAKGQHNATPLHWAAFHGNAAMTSSILRFSPPLETIDDDYGGTPLRWAIHGSENGWYARTGDYAATVALLLSAGATPPAAISGTEAVQAALMANS